MRDLGFLLLVVGGIVAALVNFFIGAILIVMGLLAVIAGGQKTKPTAICEKCGNPVARTANVCPTCGTKLVPTEGPLAPPQDPAARRREGMLGLYAIVGALILIVALVVNFLLGG
jgi:hypothetical protein